MKGKRQKKEAAPDRDNRNWEYSEKLGAMKVLDNHDGNYAAAGLELGLHRTTLFKWKQQYWEDYLEQKDKVADHMLTVQAKKMVMFGATEELSEKAAQLFVKGVDWFLEGDNFDKLPAKEKVQLVNIIAPYALDKKGTMGVKDQTPIQQNNFFQNVFNQIRNGSNQGEVSGNLKTITLPE